MLRKTFEQTGRSTCLSIPIPVLTQVQKDKDPPVPGELMKKAAAHLIERKII